MRIKAGIVTLIVLSVGVARAQEPPPQYAPQPQPYYAPPPQPGYAPAPPPGYYVQPAPYAPQDPARFAEWERLRLKSHRLRIGGRAALGVGIPFFLIGISVGVVAVYNDGIYLCSGIACDRNAAAAAGFTLAVLGAGGIAAGVALLVLSSRYYDEAERVRLGIQTATKWIPAVMPLARSDGRGVDGVAVAWGARF